MAKDEQGEIWQGVLDHQTHSGTLGSSGVVAAARRVALECLSASRDSRIWVLMHAVMHASV